jgi:DMSO/TMAO reductase YedYZ molybdopterin-dependent catalytic subunit
MRQDYIRVAKAIVMTDNSYLLDEHKELTRRFFLSLGVLGALATRTTIQAAHDDPIQSPKPAKAGAQPDPYFTTAEDFQDVSRGNPIPHTLSDEKKREIGLTRESWKLEVLSDKGNPSRLGKSFTKTDGTSLDFASLLKLGEQHAVRFPKVMTCLNLGCPLGMGLWEGVPLREVVWLTQPRDNLRRVFYYGYHNDDPKQMFRSSLPISRVLEDPNGLPPVILCYKLNGNWLDAKRGGPVRIVVPEAYGFKSVKWLTHVVLTNLAHANDTYAEQNNDIDSPLKTFSASLSVPSVVKPGKPIQVSGYAQVGVSGLAKVQVSIESKASPRLENDPYFTKASWVNAEILSAPKQWNSLREGKIPGNTYGFTTNGIPKKWPLRLTNAHWAAVLPGLPVGEYIFRSRTIDDQGYAQPMPRPFRKSGYATIESIEITVRE